MIIQILILTSYSKSSNIYLKLWSPSLCVYFRNSMYSACVILLNIHSCLLLSQSDHSLFNDRSSKLSIALDCWTSPFQQAFMAITGYFIDKDWQYREILLGFEPLHERHTGANLSAVLLDILQQHNLVDRVLALTCVKQA